MSQLAVRMEAAQRASLNRAKLQIQKPEVSTYRPPSKPAQSAAVGWTWKLMVGLTYLFSFITFYFVFTV